VKRWNVINRLEGSFKVNIKRYASVLIVSNKLSIISKLGTAIKCYIKNSNSRGNKLFTLLLKINVYNNIKGAYIT
jgi:hypothetical protein